MASASLSARMERFNMNKYYLTIIAVVFCADVAKAQVAPPATPPAPLPESFSAERPGYAAGTDTVPLGRYQIELGYTYANGGGSSQSRFLDGTQVRFPLNDRVEWRIGVPAYVTAKSDGDTVSGFADVSLSAKWRLLDAAPHRPSLALIVNTNLPTGRRDIGSHYFQPGSSLQAAYGLNDKWGLSGSVTYADARDAAATFNQFGFSIGADYALNAALGVFGEVYRFSKTGGESGGANFFDGGVTYQLNPRTQLDISSGVGLSGDAKNSYFISAGIARRW